VAQGPVGYTTNWNYKVEYTWNAASQRTEKKLTVRTQTAKTWTLSYNDDGQLQTVSNPDSETTSFYYLPDGRLRKVILRANNLTSNETREFFYQDTDDGHQYVAQKNKHLRQTWDRKKNGQTIVKFAYDLDAAGNRLGVTFWNETGDSKYYAYDYDAIYQLKGDTKFDSKIDRDKGYEFKFNYDLNGNRAMKFSDGVETDYTYGDNNEMTAAGGDTFTYDQFGNTKTKVSGGNTTTYNYDFEGHLTSVDYPGTSNDDTHEYDGDGKRMRSKLNGAADWTNFIYDELTGELLAEYTLISGTYTIKSLNTWGVGLISTNREGTKRYFHFDGLGSTWALTDSSSAITDTYRYTAFGTSDSGGTGSSVNPFRFAGKHGCYDDGARGSMGELVVNGNLMYSPGQGRYFNTPAPGRYGQSAQGLGGPMTAEGCITYLGPDCDEQLRRCLADAAASRNDCLIHCGLFCSGIQAACMAGAFAVCMTACLGSLVGYVSCVALCVRPLLAACLRIGLGCRASCSELCLLDYFNRVQCCHEFYQACMAGELYKGSCEGAGFIPPGIKLCWR